MSGAVIVLPLSAAAVSRVAGLLLSRLDDSLAAGELTEAGYSDAFAWLESWAGSHSARLGVAVVS